MPYENDEKRTLGAIRVDKNCSHYDENHSVGSFFANMPRRMHFILSYQWEVCYNKNWYFRHIRGLVHGKI